LSLPLALLIWAILAFVFSVVCYSFRGSVQAAGGTQENFTPYTYWTIAGITALMTLGGGVISFLLLDIWNCLWVQSVRKGFQWRGWRVFAKKQELLPRP